MTEKPLVCVGAILGAFGVKGELRVKSFCADPSALDSYKPLTTEDGSETFDLKLIGPIKGGYNARIKGIQYKDQADALKGKSLWVPRDVLPNLPDDEFYYSDLKGLDVYDTGGQKVGKVLAVFDHGAGDYLEITTHLTKNNLLLPFTRQAVPTIDLTTKRLIIDPPSEQSVTPNDSSG